MRRWIVSARLPALCIVFACLSASAAESFGANKTEAFLDGLRQRDLYDVALQMLEAIRDDPKTDKPMREMLDYQFGVTLIGAARNLPSEEREKQYDKAREYLEKFLEEQPKHLLADSAIRNLTDLKLERGEALVGESRQTGILPDGKQRLLERARTIFEESQKSLTEIDARLVKKKQYFNKLETEDPLLIEQLHQLVGEMLLTRLSLSKTYYDLAQTYEPGSEKNITLLREARKKFSEYYWKYSRWLGGYAFRLEQARCSQELGDYDLALEVLEALAYPVSDDDDSARRVRVAAARMTMETYLLPKVKQYGKAWELFQQWENNFHRSRVIDDAIPDLSYLGGEAALELAREADGNDPNQSRLRNLYRKRAKELFSVAARYPGAYKLKARLKLGDPLLTSGELKIDPPKNYEEARDRANLAWNQSLDPSMKPDQVERFRAEAALCLQYALAHPPEEAKIEELNSLRQKQAYLDWIAGDYYRAAALGEFLARRYTDRPEGQKGAEIALAAYAGMLQESPADDNQFETSHIVRLADFATKHWPKENLADNARLTLLRSAYERKDAAKALELLGAIPTDSPSRGEAELLAGQTLWIDWLRLNRLPEDKRPGAEEMDKLLGNARRILTEGVGRLKDKIGYGEKPSYSLGAATLSLGQICLEQDQGGKAVEWLINPQVGAYLMAMSNEKEYDRGNFRVEAFKAALRAFVAVDQTQRAEQAMELLEKNAPAENLTNIYIALGRELENNFKQAVAGQEVPKIDRAARGLDLFLTRISNRPTEQASYQSLFWAAEAFDKMGEILSPGDGPLTNEGRTFYAKAAVTYGRIIDICRKDKEFAPRADAVSGIQIRLAQCLRKLGKYKDALDLIVEILAERNNLVNAQIEAALTYQAWGTVKPGYYLLAIRGGRKAKLKSGEVVYLVWGWNGIARRTQHSEQHQNIFYEAKYNQALCRLRYASSLDANKKTEQLKFAEQDILLLQRLRPDMGGKKWYNQFDGALNDIQAELGVAKGDRGLKAAERKISGK